MKTTGDRFRFWGMLLLAGAIVAVAVPWAAAADADGASLDPVPAEADAQIAPSPPDSSAATDEIGDDLLAAPFCSPPGRFWLRADYLMWWTSGTRLPALVTTSPQGTAVADAGVLPNAEVLYGDGRIANDGRSGFRTTVGMYLDACHVWDLEFDYLSLGARSNNFSATSTGNPILARPYFNVWDDPTGGHLVGQASELVAYPGVVEGTVSVAAQDYFQSVGATLSYKLCACDSCCDPCDLGDATCGPPMLFCCRTDLLFGFRYYNLSDRLTVTENLNDLIRGEFIDIHDNFRARNDFYGSEIGLRTQVYRGRWSLDVTAKMAAGNTHRTITINGDTTFSASGQPTQQYPAGILAGYSNNNGNQPYQRDSFTVIPQLGLELGYQVTNHLRAYVGYNLLYWGCVSRSADQIDVNLDPRNFPPPEAGAIPFPAFPDKTACFWAQGVNLGTEFRF